MMNNEADGDTNVFSFFNLILYIFNGLIIVINFQPLDLLLPHVFNQ
jgi:hypothetical protein